MVGLGLILLVLSGALATGVAVDNSGDAPDVSAFGYSVANLTIGELFLFGALTGLVFGLGLAMLISGAARRRTVRRGLKSQVKAVREERESLAEENARLQEQLVRERTTSVTPVADDVYPTEPGRHAADLESQERGFRR
jgi:hypothetical protein